MVARYFGATSDRVEVANSTSIQNLSRFTFLGWFKWDPTLTNAWAALFTKGASKRLSFESTDVTDFQGELTTNGTPPGFGNVAHPLKVGVWTFIAFRGQDGSAGFIDAWWATFDRKPVRFAFGAGTGTGNSDSADDLEFGSWHGQSTRAFRGAIASPSYWNRVLSPSEVAAQWLRPSVGTGCVCFPRLTDGKDMSGNGNDASIVGATLATGPQLPFERRHNTYPRTTAKRRTKLLVRR